MLDKTIIDMTALSLTFGFAFWIHCYESLAIEKGWTIGDLFINTRNTRIGSLATFISLLSLGVSFYLYHWWSPFVVALAGYLAIIPFLIILKSSFQVLTLAGSLCGLTWIILRLSNVL